MIVVVLCTSLNRPDCLFSSLFPGLCAVLPVDAGHVLSAQLHSTHRLRHVRHPRFHPQRWHGLQGRRTLCDVAHSAKHVLKQGADAAAGVRVHVGDHAPRAELQVRVITHPVQNFRYASMLVITHPV